MTALPSDLAALIVVVAAAATLGVSLPRPRVLGTGSVVLVFVATSALLLAACSIEDPAWGVGLAALAVLPLVCVTIRRHRRVVRMPVKLGLYESLVPVCSFGMLLLAVHVRQLHSVSTVGTLLVVPLGGVVAWLKSRYDWARDERGGWDEQQLDQEFASTWTAIAPLGVACLLAFGAYWGSAAVATGTDSGTAAEPTTLVVLAAACAVTALALWGTYRFETSRRQASGASLHGRTRTRWPVALCATAGLLAAGVLLMSRAAGASDAPTAWIGVAAGLIAALGTVDSLIENSSTLQLTRPNGGTLLLAAAAALLCGAAWWWLLTDGLWASGAMPYRVLSALLVASGCLALTTYVPYLTARIIDLGRVQPRLTENAATMNIGQDALHLSLFTCVAFVAPYWFLADTTKPGAAEFYSWLLTPSALLTVFLFTLKNNRAHLREQEQHNSKRPARLAQLLRQDEEHIRRRFMSRLTWRIRTQEVLFVALTVASFTGLIVAYFSGSAAAGRG